MTELARTVCRATSSTAALKRIVTAAQLAMQSRVLLPTTRVPQIQRSNIEEGANRGHGDLELRSQAREVVLQLPGEGQQIVPVIVHQTTRLREALRAVGPPRLQFRNDEVIKSTAVGIGRAGHREDILTEPADQHGHVLGEGDGLGLGRPRVPQFLREGRLAPATPFLALGLLVLELAAGGDGLVGAIFQRGHEGFKGLQSMKHIATTGKTGQRQFLPRAQAAAEIGNGGVRSETAVAQFQQAHAPGYGIAVFLLAQQITIGGEDVGTHQNGSSALEDFVMGADADVGQILPGVVVPCCGHAGMNDVVDLADGERIVHFIAAFQKRFSNCNTATCRKIDGSAILHLPTAPLQERIYIAAGKLFRGRHWGFFIRRFPENAR